jgi:hypothetical protein
MYLSTVRARLWRNISSIAKVATPAFLTIGDFIPLHGGMQLSLGCGCAIGLKESHL